MSERTFEDYVTEGAECPTCDAVHGEFCDSEDMFPHVARTREFLKDNGELFPEQVALLAFAESLQ